jgi:hypothetical protein
VEASTKEKPASGRTPKEEQMAAQAKKADEDAAGGDAEPLDGEHADQQAPPKLPPVELEGSGDQLTLKITGGDPDKGTAKLQGGKVEMPRGENQLGDVVEAVVRMRCTEVAVIDKMNNTTGQVTERERVHKFKIMGIERITT